MIDFIPLKFYGDIYFYVLLLVVVVTFAHTQIKVLGSSSNVNFTTGMGIFVFLFSLLYIGLRPISGAFVDMMTYYAAFMDYAGGAPVTSVKDVFFRSFTKFSSQIMSAEMYFFVNACLYIIPLYLVSKNWFKQYWFYGFVFLLGSFAFWSYGTNGIRNGVAGSLFLLGMSRDKRSWQIVWIILSIAFHKTMILPAMGFVLANFYNKPIVLIRIWILAIPLSFIGGRVFETLFSSIGFGEDDRLMAYLTSGVAGRNVFRWDFLLYSSTAVFAGWYYTVVLKYKDKIYFWLFNTFLFANIFWILVIRAYYSYRFAYLSWFMMALVIIYPLLKVKLVPAQHKKIGVMLVIYFAFTFYMNVFLH